MKTSFLPGLISTYHVKERTQVRKKVKEFKIPDKRLGSLAAYIIVWTFIFIVLCAFMDFPSLHAGKTYVQKADGKWMKIDKPFFSGAFKKVRYIPPTPED